MSREITRNGYSLLSALIFAWCLAASRWLLVPETRESEGKKKTGRSALQPTKNAFSTRWIFQPLFADVECTRDKISRKQSEAKYDTMIRWEKWKSKKKKKREKKCLNDAAPSKRYVQRFSCQLTKKSKDTEGTGHFRLCFRTGGKRRQKWNNPATVNTHKFERQFENAIINLGQRRPPLDVYHSNTSARIPGEGEARGSRFSRERILGVLGSHN